MLLVTLLLASLIVGPTVNPDIDAATGESETSSSVLRRSVHLAQCLRRLGLVTGDILALSGKNHLDNFIPFYAALMNGLPLVGVDPLLTFDDVKPIIELTEPKIVFCEPEKYGEYVKAATDLGLNTRVVTFGKGEHSMQKLLDTYPDDTSIEEFEVATFDGDKVFAWLLCTGGTSGSLKLVAITHETWKQKYEHGSNDTTTCTKSETVKRNDESNPGSVLLLGLTSIHWIASVFLAARMPVNRFTKLQTSAPVTTGHIIDIINKYKPHTMTIMPHVLSLIIKNEKLCDLSCFKSIVVSGDKVLKDLLVSIREIVPKETTVKQAYGQTENLGLVLAPNPTGPIDNCGRPLANVQVKLVDPENGKAVIKPYVKGELWTKGPGFTCYYKNLEETAKAFSADGWYKTGDLLYRDENHNYFFVERLQMIIRYKIHQIFLPELEAVVRLHEGVLDVSCTGIPYDKDVEHAVACVVRQPGATVTAQEIKDLVASKLPETKQLHGGVVFLNELPLTPAGKVAQGKLRQLVLNMHRE